jgi:hypothetical protein
VVIYIQLLFCWIDRCPEKLLPLNLCGDFGFIVAAPWGWVRFESCQGGGVEGDWWCGKQDRRCADADGAGVRRRWGRTTGRSDRYVLFTILLTEREKIYKLVYLAIGKPIFNIRKRKKSNICRNEYKSNSWINWYTFLTVLHSVLIPFLDSLTNFPYFS